MSYHDLLLQKCDIFQKVDFLRGDGTFTSSWKRVRVGVDCKIDYSSSENEVQFGASRIRLSGRIYLPTWAEVDERSAFRFTLMYKKASGRDIFARAASHGGRISVLGKTVEVVVCDWEAIGGVP